jgi:hypothetical protein
MKRADFQPPVDGARRLGRSGSEEAGPESDAMAAWRLRLVCSRSASEHGEPLLSAGVGASRRVKRKRRGLFRKERIGVGAGHVRVWQLVAPF